MARMYQSMMDEGRVEQLGIEPLKADLAKVAAIKSKADFARYMGTTNGSFGSALYAFDLEPGHGRRQDEHAVPRPGRPRLAESRLLPESPSSSRSSTPIAPTSSARSTMIGYPTPAKHADRGPRVRDRDREGQLGGRRSPRHRQDQQPDEHRRAADLRAGPQLGRVLRPAPRHRAERDHSIVHEKTAIKRDRGALRRRRRSRR